MNYKMLQFTNDLLIGMVDHQTSPGLYQNETGLFSHKPLLGFSHLVLFDGQREARREIGPSTISARLRLAVSC